MVGRIVAVCRSDRKGEKKSDVGDGFLKEGFGLEGDAHAGEWHRQVSLLSSSSIQKMRDRGLDVGPGDFAENLTVDGLDVAALPLGTRLEAGETVLEITQVGKECHTGCAVFKQVGECIMPREGVFARVVKAGRVKKGDSLRVIAEPGRENRRG